MQIKTQIHRHIRKCPQKLKCSRKKETVLYRKSTTDTVTRSHRSGLTYLWLIFGKGLSTTDTVTRSHRSGLTLNRSGHVKIISSLVISLRKEGRKNNGKTNENHS